MKEKERVRSTYGNGTVYQKNESTWIAQKTVLFEGYGKRKISGSGPTESKAVRKREENIKEFRKRLEKEKAERTRQKDIQIENDTDNGENDTSLGTLLLDDFRRVKNNATLTTYDTYMNEYNFYIKDYPIADMDISEITEEDLWEYYKELFLHGKRRDGGGLNYITVNKARAHIRRIFKKAFHEGVIKKDVHENIHTFNESSFIKFDSGAIIKASTQGNVIAQVGKKVHPMTEEEARCFLEAARGTRFFTLFALALSSGCRRGELLGLTWDCVHMDKQCIMINKSLAYVKRNQKVVGESEKIPVLKEPKTKSSHRIIPLNKIAICVLEIARAEQNEEKRLFKEDYRDKNLVFCNAVGDYYTEGQVRYWFKKCCKIAEIPEHTLHDCRHTVCSFLINRGAQPKLIQTLLGHSLLSTTMDIYGEMFLDVESQFINKLDEVYGIEDKGQQDDKKRI